MTTQRGKAAAFPLRLSKNRACLKSTRRGGPRSPVDFAQAKSVADRRKIRLFSFGKSEKRCFSAGEHGSPLRYLRKSGFFDSLNRPGPVGTGAVLLCFNPSKSRLFFRGWRRRGAPFPHFRSRAGRWCRRSARRAGHFPGRRGWSSRQRTGPPPRW